MATSWAWRTSFGPAVQEPARRRSSKGDEFNKAARRQPLRRHRPFLRQQPGTMVPAPPTSLPRLRPVRVPKLAPGVPPAILRPARAPCRARWLLSQDATAVKNKAPMSLSTHRCPQFRRFQVSTDLKRIQIPYSLFRLLSR